MLECTDKKILKTYFSSSLEETKQYGAKFSHFLKKGDILAFFGEIGSGKTSFIKGLISYKKKIKEEQINSPTFTYLNIYEGKLPFYHFDLYRLQQAQDFYLMGFDDFFSSSGICLIEWAKRLSSLPKGTIEIHIKHISFNKREIIIYKKNE